eukprot:CAMPEP_0181331590 /NCGR_PEP_ID=MMETSP1101-20121128/24589_1 /TAXON_ID=46948 /ORGANISM="Rhodomonas abbreviata, Strain Caron Lab Isolate" /LENGTH=502 /DNA_ID=CAMNT_0023441073 /DNA_START=231 /DNA_END=1736 /DNA_ORIENTATION=+
MPMASFRFDRKKPKTRRNFGLLIFLSIGFGADAVPNAGRLLSENMVGYNLNCSIMVSEAACYARDGCSWCTTVGSAKESCVPWQSCAGPVGRCELITTAQACGQKALRRQEGIEMQGDDSCKWCTMESRCVTTSHQLKELRTTPDLGQCVGCDGAFDSGVVLDACGRCGGACTPPFVTVENQLCWCLGCDGVPFSHVRKDICGVCGGTNSTCTQFPFTAQQGIGIALALSGNFLISLSLNLQKYVHNLNEEMSGGAKSYTEIPLWWFGMFLMVTGESGNFLAYAYASATLVAPLGAITVISNCILAHYVLKEELRKRNILGVVLAIVGAVFIVTYAPGSDKQLTMELLEQYMSQGSFILFVLCILFTVIGLFLTSETYKKKYVVVYLLICSLLGCLTVMCVKGVSTALILTIRGKNAFHHLLPWVLVATLLGTGIVQIRILNLAMINFGASEVVPVYYVLFTFCSIVGGMVMYKEYHQHCPDDYPHCHHTLYFLLGCAVTFS